MAIIKCPECGSEVSDKAEKCPKCAYPISGQPVADKAQTTKLTNKKLWNPGIAAVLSLVIPGAGQIYRGKLGRGFLWLAIVLIGYALFIIPGLVLHIFCIIAAYCGDPYEEKPKHQNFKLTNHA